MNTTLLALACALFPIAAQAAGASSSTPPEAFAGAWRIVAAVPSGDGGREPIPLERLRNAQLRFDRGHAPGPVPFACEDARYEVVESPPRGLFQGAFGEDADAAAARATKLGLSATASPTLRVTCPNSAFDYHATAPGTARPRLMTMLDYVVYVFEREPPAAAQPSP